MSEPLLNIVMPVYNVAPYLPRCLESLATLNPPPDEIIVVDDGSTDACPRILVDYAGKLPQMRVIRQENAGLSAARNTGLAAARGKYLAFVDSDDFLAPAAYRQALEWMEQDNLEMVLLNGCYHFEGRAPDRPIYPDLAPTPGVISGRQWLAERLAKRHLLHMVWLHLYRRDFIERQGLRFIPGLIHEDVIWTTTALLAARRIRVCNNIAVYYRIRHRSRTREQQQQLMEALVASSTFNARTLAEITSRPDIEPELSRQLSWQLVDGALSVFHKIEKMPDRTKARQTQAKLLREGFLTLLWRHAQTAAQRRRILRNCLVCFAACVLS